MNINDILATIGLFLVYATALISVYVNLRVKMKELEIKMLHLQDEFAQHKLKISNDVERLEERNTVEHDAILCKIDIILEKIAQIRVEQATFHKLPKNKQ